MTFDRKCGLSTCGQRRECFRPALRCRFPWLAWFEGVAKEYPPDPLWAKGLYLLAPVARPAPLWRPLLAPLAHSATAPRKPKRAVDSGAWRLPQTTDMRQKQSLELTTGATVPPGTYLTRMLSRTYMPRQLLMVIIFLFPISFPSCANYFSSSLLTFHCGLF